MNQKVHTFDRNNNVAAFVAEASKAILDVPVTLLIQKLVYKAIGIRATN